ncbi:MAG: DEAD/DEAH box helicase [Firmicutes bacterium]|nr:DEAD/DEAH box helicase [Bacillota bacterium]
MGMEMRPPILYRPENLEILERLAAGQFENKGRYELNQQANRLSLAEGFDRLLSLEALPEFTLYDHQKAAILKVLRQMRGRAVLADEVGLGKTIEAGIILKEYILRGLARKVLILAPASLTTQWEQEMRRRLGLDFAVNTRPEGWEAEDLVIASLDTAKRAPHAGIIQKIKYDVVVVDEAHKLKNNTTVIWRFVDGLHKKHLLLLTATPVQNGLRELYNMITLLKPGQLKTYSAFKREFMLDKRVPKNTGRLKDLLGEVMVRTSRRETLLRFPKRLVTTLEVELDGREHDFYAAVAEFARTVYLSQPEEKHNLLPLILLLREACSSACAAQRTLEQMLRRAKTPAEKAGLQDLVTMAGQISGQKKAEMLLDFLAATDEKVIVFTEFTATMEFLCRLLKQAGIPAAKFHGGLSLRNKDEAIAAFRAGKRVLVSTEAGGEGRNLQFCHQMVNYDLPWNPMRVEQRIGRIHRLGQQKDVRILNFATRGTVEAYVLYLLDRKIHMFETVVGELEMIMEDLDGKSFETCVADLILSSRSEADLYERVEAFGEELAAARRRYEEIRRLNDQLAGLESETGEGWETVGEHV